MKEVTAVENNLLSSHDLEKKKNEAKHLLLGLGNLK